MLTVTNGHRNRRDAEGPDVAGSDVTASSVTDLHRRLCDGDSQATERLWETYFSRMVLVARKQLKGAPTVARDEEDIALSAFKSFCIGIQQGRIQLGQGQINLWPLLVTITLNKAVDQIRHENRKKRRVASSRQVVGDPTLEELVSCDPSPELLAAATESFDALLAALDRSGDAQLKAIAIASIEGNSLSEIAQAMDCSARTVQRKLKTIRRVWQGESQ